MIKSKIKTFLCNKKDNIRYKLWIKNNEPSKSDLEIQRKEKFKNEPLISIIVPMYNTNIEFFKQLVRSVKNQTYSKWELCLADGSEIYNKNIENVINDSRIKYLFLNKNGGISENSNEAIKMATGDYYGFLDHDDVLAENALYEIVKIINNNVDVDFLYTDEDKIICKKRVNPNFKTDFDLDALLSYNYICHFTVIKKELLNKIGNFRKEYDGAQDYDLILRATDKATRIIHIPKVLYHWRICNNSTAYNSDTKPYAFVAGKKAISNFLNEKRN